MKEVIDKDKQFILNNMHSQRKNPEIFNISRHTSKAVFPRHISENKTRKNIDYEPANDPEDRNTAPESKASDLKIQTSFTLYDMFLKRDINRLKLYYQNIFRLRPENLNILGPDAMKFVFNLVKQYKDVLDYSWSLQLSNYASGKVDYVYSEVSRAVILSTLGLPYQRTKGIRWDQLDAVFIDMDYVVPNNESLNSFVFDIMYKKMNKSNFTFILSTNKRITNIYEFIGRQELYDKIKQENLTNYNLTINDADIMNLISKLLKEPIPSDNTQLEAAIRQTASEQKQAIKDASGEQKQAIKDASDEQKRAIKSSTSKIQDTLNKTVNIDDFQFKVRYYANLEVPKSTIGVYAVTAESMESENPTILKLTSEPYKAEGEGKILWIDFVDDNDVEESIKLSEIRIIRDYKPLEANTQNKKYHTVQMNMFHKVDYDDIMEKIKSGKGFKNKLSGGALSDIKYPNVNTFEKAYTDITAQKNIYVFSLGK